MVLRVAMSTHGCTPVKRNELGELPGLTQSEHIGAFWSGLIALPVRPLHISQSILSEPGHRFCQSFYRSTRNSQLTHRPSVI